MSLTFYDLPHSPYCLPIKRALGALNVPFDLEDVPNWDRRKVIEVTNGAYYQVPVLVQNGRAVYETGPDTNDVARFVDAEFASHRLFPDKLSGLHDILIAYLDNDVEGATFRATDAFYVDSIADQVGKVMTIRHKERKFGRGCIEQWKANLENLRADAAQHFARFDAMLQHQTYLLGPQPVYADFLLYGILTNYTWNGWNEIPASLTFLKTWYQRLQHFSFSTEEL